MQMVFMPQYEDQLIPLAELAIALRVDYLVIKHCSDDEFGSLGVKYGDYEKCYEKLKEAESMSNERTKIEVKWSKIKECNEKGAIRTYSNCYGAPFILQLSGSGLVAPCGMLFNERYKWAHIGNITRTRFKEMWKSSKYWEVMNYLAGRGTIEGMEPWDAKTDCGSLCLQHCTNRALDNHIKGNKIEFNNTDVLHRKFL